MKAWHIRTGIVGFWLIMLFCLIRIEAYPEWFTHSLQGYKGILSRDLMVEGRWYRIMVNNQPAGYAYTSIDVEDDTPEKFLLMDNRTHLRVSLLGTERDVHVQSSIRLNDLRRVHDFEARIMAQQRSFAVRGTRVNDETYRIVTSLGNLEQTRQIQIPDDVLLYAPVTEMAMRALRPGQSLIIKTLDPMTMTSARINVTADAQEEISVAGAHYTTTRLRSDFRGMELCSWITEDGRLVRQETPLGWMLEACSSEQALAAVSTENEAPELLISGAGGLLGLLMGHRENME